MAELADWEEGLSVRVTERLPGGKRWLWDREKRVRKGWPGVDARFVYFISWARPCLTCALTLLLSYVNTPATSPHPHLPTPTPPHPAPGLPGIMGLWAQPTWAHQVAVLDHSPVSDSFLSRMWETHIPGGRWERKDRKNLATQNNSLRTFLSSGQDGKVRKLWLASSHDHIKVTIKL